MGIKSKIQNLKIYKGGKEFLEKQASKYSESLESKTPNASRLRIDNCYDNYIKNITAILSSPDAASAEFCYVYLNYVRSVHITKTQVEYGSVPILPTDRIDEWPIIDVPELDAMGNPTGRVKKEPARYKGGNHLIAVKKGDELIDLVTGQKIAYRPYGYNGISEKEIEDESVLSDAALEDAVKNPGLECFAFFPLDSTNVRRFMQLVDNDRSIIDAYYKAVEFASTRQLAKNELQKRAERKRAKEEQNKRLKEYREAHPLDEVVKDDSISMEAYFDKIKDEHSKSKSKK